jgi:hypothetical protein
MIGHDDEVPYGYMNNDHLNDLEGVLRTLKIRQTKDFETLSPGYNGIHSRQFEEIVVPGTQFVGENIAEGALNWAEDSLRVARGFHKVGMYPEAHKHVVAAARSMILAHGYIGTTDSFRPTPKQQRLIDDENLDYPPHVQAKLIADDYGRKYL